MPRPYKIIILVFVVSLFGAFGYGILTEAGSGDNISGFAYSENIGWVSFNSISDGASISYGVNLGVSGKFSGYAWSENIGWISFNESDTGSPPSDDPCSDDSCIAKINPPGQLGKSNVDVKGWARALAYADGWNGWIRFDHGQSNEPYIDINGDWHGWAWGSDVVGWLSFNGADADAGGDYKVTLGGVNHSPTASDLEVIKGDYCTVPSHYFSWIYSDMDGDDESQFQFQVDNNSDFSSPEVDRCGDGQTPVGGICPAPGTLSNSSPTTNNQIVVVAVSPGSDQIGYNTTYYWRVKVWDSQGADSGWIEGSSLTTETHRYPSIDFSWSPTEPSQEEDVAFSDQSTVYGGSTKSAWAWTFVNGNPAISSQQNPTIQFTANGPKSVTLQVTDSDGFLCEDSKSVGVQVELPGWQEILPQ